AGKACDELSRRFMLDMGISSPVGRRPRYRENQRQAMTIGLPYAQLAAAGRQVLGLEGSTHESRNMPVAQLSAVVHWSVSQHGPCSVAAYAYFEGARGSIPLFLIASEARAEARNSISRLERSMSPEPATTAAENVCTNWISDAMLPAKSTPGAC